MHFIILFIYTQQSALLVCSGKKESHINYNNSAVVLFHFITDNLLGKSNLKGFTLPTLHAL